MTHEDEIEFWQAELNAFIGSITTPGRRITSRQRKALVDHCDAIQWRIDELSMRADWATRAKVTA